MATLYGFFRSSAAFRVRIALNLKKISYDTVSVHLRKGQHKTEEYLKLNPMSMVPFYVDDMVSVGQSLAIIEYLEDRYPEPAILPSTYAGRARVRAIAQMVACDIHPLQNLRVMQYLEHNFKIDDEGTKTWAAHWIKTGFDALEKLLASSPDTGIFCHGDTPTMADVYLFPQILNAHRFGLDVNQWRTIARIEEACRKEEAFIRAMPENQSDAE